MQRAIHSLHLSPTWCNDIMIVRWVLNIVRLDLHFSESQRVLPASPVIPNNTVIRCGIWDWSVVVVAVQVWIKTVAVLVPPGAFVARCTIYAGAIVLLVECTELTAEMPRQRITFTQTNTATVDVFRLTTTAVYINKFNVHRSRRINIPPLQNVNRPTVVQNRANRWYIFHILNTNS